MVNHFTQRGTKVLLTAWLSTVCTGAVWSAPIGHALDRPAVISKRATQSVLLGIAQAGQRFVAVGERGIVLVSEDDAAQWRQVSTPVSVTLTAVRFANDKVGYAVGHSGTVIVTADGGQTWTRSLDGRQIVKIALAAAQASGDTTDMQEAERMANDGPDKPLLDLLVIDDKRVIVIGAYGMAYATTDGGKTWSSWNSRLQNRRGLHLYAIRSQGNRILICGEQGLARLSTDGGQSFSTLKTPYEGSFFTAELLSENHIVLAGLRGNVLRSADDGLNWKKVASPDAASITGSTQRADGSLVLVSQAGLILAEERGALVAVNKSPLPSLTGIFSTRNGSFLALSTQGVLSTSIGETK